MEENKSKKELSEKEIYNLISQDVDAFIQLSLNVIDKTSNVEVPFRLNKIQRFFSTNKSKFSVVLKSRKGGISTYIIAEALHKCLFGKNERCVLLCQNEDATFEMFNKRVLPLLKSCLIKIPYKPNKAYGIIEFPTTNSTFRVGTAGSLTFGRGSDVSFYHLSEAAFYKDNSVLTSIEEACLETAVGRIETTANGINHFYHLWQNAKLGNNKYKPVFIPWSLDDTYRIKGVGVINDLTPEEKQLMEMYHLDFEQIAWRRQKIKDMSKPELFVQEYPINDVEAFISSGKLFFNWVVLNKYEKVSCEEPKFKGYLRDVGEGGIEFVPDMSGGLSVWKMPEEKHIYIIGADVAEGIKGGAYSAAFVLDVNTMMQVAEYHKHIDPDDFGDVLITLARFYNNALLAPEAYPGPGMVTINTILKQGYYNIYKRAKSEHSHKTDDKLYGWETSKKTKTEMMYLLNEALKEFKIIIKSKPLLYEMRSIVHNEGKIEPQEGCFSDRVIACAIAYAVCKKYGYEIPIERNSLARKIFNAQQGSDFISFLKYKSKPYGVKEV